MCGICCLSWMWRLRTRVYQHSGCASSFVLCSHVSDVEPAFQRSPITQVIATLRCLNPGS